MKRFRFVAVAACVLASMAAVVALSGCAQQESYTPPTPVPEVNTPALQEEGVLHVGVDTSNAPLAGTASSSGKIVGIDVDVASALADELGLKVEFVDVGSDAQSALEKGTVDIVMGINKASAGDEFWVSDEYLPTSVVLFSAKSGAAPASDSTASIAAQVSSTSSWAVTNQFEKADLKTSNDLKSAFEQLSSGSVDYVASDAVKGLYTASRADMEPSIVALMQSVSGYGIGVLDTNSDLKQAISSALKTITSNGVVDVIETKWLGTVIDLSNVSLTDAAKAAANSAATETASDEAKSEENSGQSEESAEATTETSESEAAATTESSEASSTETEAAASTDASATTETSTTEAQAA